MYKPDFRIIHIIKTLMNSIHTIDYNTKFNILTELNIYAIDSLKQKEIMENKINELENDIKIIKAISNNTSITTVKVISKEYTIRITLLLTYSVQKFIISLMVKLSFKDQIQKDL